MSRSTFTSLAVAGVLMVGWAAVPGCGSGDPGRDRSTKAVGSLAEVRSELSTAGKQIDETQAALTALQKGEGDLTKGYEAYKGEVADLEKVAAEARERADDMRASSGEYRAKWQEQTAQLTSPDLRAAAEQRAAKFRERFAGIEAKSRAAADAYKPYITHLKEVQTYLANDLTRQSVQMAGPVFQKAAAEGELLKQKLAALSAELDDVAASMSPTGAAPR